MKYDKIKNVRDSVVNYEALYRQVCGEVGRMEGYEQKTVRREERGGRSPYARGVEKLKT